MIAHEMFTKSCKNAFLCFMHLLLLNQTIYLVVKFPFRRNRNVIHILKLDSGRNIVGFLFSKWLPKIQDGQLLNIFSLRHLLIYDIHETRQKTEISAFGSQSVTSLHNLSRFVSRQQEVQLELEDRLVISGGITERHGMAVRASSHANYISITAAAAANIVMTAGPKTSVRCTARRKERI